MVEASTSMVPNLNLEQYAAEAETRRAIPSYDELMRTSWPDYMQTLSGIRNRLSDVSGEGKLNLVVIGTGGTFQSAETDEGLAPSGSLKESFDALNLPKDETINLELIDLMNLDSSQMNVEHWRFLAEAIDKLEMAAGDKFDAIIVTHGTDTMTRGASYLSFMLQGFPKSIVFTGSQNPARQTGSDAKDQMERAITTAKLTANPNRRITEVMIACGEKVTRGTWGAKKGDKTTNAFQPWNQPNEDFDATEWAKAADEGTLDHLAPALLDFGTGKNTSLLEFARHARDYRKKGPYTPFTKVRNQADIIPVRLTDISSGRFARFITEQTVSVLTQLGSATADDVLVDIALAAANNGKAIIFEAPFADSKVAAGTYKAGSGVTRELPFLQRRLPIINTSPDAFAAKSNFLMHSLGVEPFDVAHEGLGTIFSGYDLRRFYDHMETNMVGELV